MRRSARLEKRRSSRVRLLIFLGGGLLTGLLLGWVLIWLEEPSKGKTPSSAPQAEKTKTRPPVALEDPKQPFLFYDVLGKPDPDGSRLMPLIQGAERPAQPSDKTVSPLTDGPAPTTYTVQIAALTDQGRAQALVERLVRAGYPAYLLPQQIPGKGIWYRVRIGHYHQRKEAERMVDRLRMDEQLPGLVLVERGL